KFGYSKKCFFSLNGPCALTSVSAVTQCNSDTILVEWEMTMDSPLYLVTAEGHDQTLISCNSSSYSCELQDIRCGMQYSIIVSASSDKCSSLRSPPKKIKTGTFLQTHYISCSL
uniref:Fibronectin type-III domain-containing protein n=1 Tax=Echeneis naucrates TaxID=173247 RepID=A0A665VCC8_ECHNA